MTNKQLYEKFEECKNRKKITYRELAKALNTSAGAVHDKVNRLKNGKSVYTDFLIKLEEIFGESIFFTK